MKRIGGFVFFILQYIYIYSQPSVCRITNSAFQAGEEITYELSYNWGIPWVKAGFAKFSVAEKILNDKPYYQLIGRGSTYESWDWVYKMRAVYQTYVDQETVRPIYHKRDVVEPTYFIDTEYKFNWRDTVVFVKHQTIRHPLRYDTMKVTPCTYDIMSILYYARNLDYSNAKIGELFLINIILDNELFNVYFKYLGKEPLKIKKIGKFNCLKFAVYTIQGTMFDEGENMFLWVTDDANKIALQVETPILVGSIRATVIDMKGIRHEFTSKK